MIMLSARIALLVGALTCAAGLAMAQTPSPTPPAPSPAAQAPQTQPAPAAPPLPQTLTVDEFRRELVGIPLCGTPTTGPLAGKQLCTVHLPDGTAIVAGAGLVVRGVWEVEDGKICRRNAHDDKRRCVEYERLSPERYRNSDGVEFCLGPCPN